MNQRAHRKYSASRLTERTAILVGVLLENPPGRTPLSINLGVILTQYIYSEIVFAERSFTTKAVSGFPLAARFLPPTRKWLYRVTISQFRENRIALSNVELTRTVTVP